MTNSLAARLQYAGGDQAGRIKKNKLRSFHSALKNSYNARKIKTPNGSCYLALMNTDNTKTDYDKKFLSVDFSSGIETGDTFECLDDGTHWMVYLPQLTETAYLRSEIIRCRYQLNIDGTDYWVYFQGPSETDLRWFQKNGINANELNLSGTIFIKKDEHTLSFFKRFTRVKLAGHVWEVEVTDSITVPGIIELEMQEYYDNSIEELPEVRRAEDGIDSDEAIIGLTSVKQDSLVGYAIVNDHFDPKASWSVRNNPRVKIDGIYDNGRMCQVKVCPGAIRTFDVVYGDEEPLTVTVDWECPGIHGPQEVYPYDEHTYWLHLPEGCDEMEFSIDDNSMAEIVAHGTDFCKVNVVSGRSGSFTVIAKSGDIVTELPVKIKSL